MSTQKPETLISPILLLPQEHQDSQELETKNGELSLHLIPPTPIDAPSSSNSSTPFAFPPTAKSTSKINSNLAGHSRSSSPHTHHRRNSEEIRIRETLCGLSTNLPNKGRTVNSYLISPKELGKGSYATVFLAEDRETNVFYAVKEFSKQKLRRLATKEAKRAGGRGRGRMGPKEIASTMKREPSIDIDEEDQGVHNLNLIKKEVAIMKKVHHPSLCRIHEIIDINSTEGSDSLMIVMELCSGGPIIKLGENCSPMSEEKARDIFKQLTEAVAYLHHNWIVHRDIKPENVLLLADGKTVKLVDFGVSQIFENDDDSLLAASAGGTPAYMAPESYTTGSSSAHGFECDAWSLGVTLYCMVVGKLPFYNSSLPELAKSILEDEPEIPSHLSPELRSLLESLLDKNPATRLTVPELWNDPWLNSQNILIDYETNVDDPITEPSEFEIGNAFVALKAWRSSTAVLKAFSKFKAKRKSTSGSNTDNEGVQVRPLEMLLTAEPLPMDQLIGDGSDAGGTGEITLSESP